MAYELDRPQLPYYLLLVLLVLAYGVLFSSLNQLLYDSTAPFFDSCVYTNRLAQAMNETRQFGVVGALTKAIDNTTVYTPWAFAVLLGKWFEPSRTIGVWIQSVPLLLFTLSLFYFFYRVKKLDGRISLAATIAFLSLQILFQFHGGLSDFRQDLTLFLTFSAAALWYLIAREEKRYLPWLLFGALCGYSSLSRATAAVYFGVTFAPLLLTDFFLASDKRRFIRQTALAGVGCVVLCGWFYFVKFDDLYNYYVKMNTDARMGLPFSVALGHFKFAYRHIGAPLLVFACVWHFVLVFSQRSFSLLNPITLLRSIDYRVLYMAIAPAGYLAYKGAGFNPFVSMPSSFGMLLFLLFPTGAALVMRNRGVAYSLLLLAVVLNIWTVRMGIEDHRSHRLDSMDAHVQVLKTVARHAGGRQQNEVNLGVLQIFYLYDCSLKNVLQYDLGARYVDRGSRELDGVMFHVESTLSYAGIETWRLVPGKTDQDKIDGLVHAANRDLDYMVLPDETTIEHLEKFVSHNLINKHARVIKKMLLETGNWVAVSPLITNISAEKVRVYRNESRVEYVPAHPRVFQRLEEELSNT